MFGALLGKEFAFFISRPNYMLNCGMAVLLMPACGVLLLFKGQMFCDAIGQALADRTDSAAVLLCAALCMLASMNDMAAPSVSLEGKSLWIAQSLPVLPKTVLRAKAAMQMLLTGVPMLIASVCAAIIVPVTVPVKVLVCITPLFCSVFLAMFDLTVGVKMPILNWTNEIVPIKQSGSVIVALFGGWAVSVVFSGLYLLIGYRFGAAPYLLFFDILFLAAGLVLLRWLDSKGSRLFAELSA